VVKIMIVDDDRTTVKLLQTLLELDGFEVIPVPRGGEVMSKLEVTHPDIMLIDYHLTDMEGVDIIREMRQHPSYSSMPIIMASGMDVEREAMAAGATVFLLKPFEPDDLPVMFNRLLAV
jgi:DNA-binding response OmpR family regulator